MFAYILFDFAGEHTQRQYFTFELPEEVGPIKKGQVVVVEGANPGEKKLGIFICAFPVDFEAQRFPEKYPSRKKVIKKVHKNSLISLVKKRYEIVKNLKVSKSAYKKYKKDFKNNENKSLEEVRKLLMRNIIVASEKHRQKPKFVRAFSFGNMKIILSGNTVMDIIQLEPKKVEWVRPFEVEQIAVEYIEKMSLIEQL